MANPSGLRACGPAEAQGSCSHLLGPPAGAKAKPAAGSSNSLCANSVQAVGGSAAAALKSASASQHFRGHQRRQSVARLLPDISKLRLLSWLVEASSELISCDIAIMDGVYAKLNKSQESLLFWSGKQNQQQQHHQQQQQQQQPPAPPSVQPVPNRLVISQRRRKQLLQSPESGSASSARDHHSLPLTNYDASSLAAVSLSPSLGATGGGKRAGAADRKAGSSLCGESGRQAVAAPAAAEDSCDSNQSELEDDDDRSSSSSGASSSSASSSSGIHGGLSSAASSSSSSSGRTSAGGLERQQQRQQAAAQQQQPVCQSVSSAEQLSERIRRTVMEHNYLQSLLVNVIRQHDRQRDELRRRQQADDRLNHQNVSANHHHLMHTHARIDLADIADSLDDGCLCQCHSDGRRTSQPAGLVAKVAVGPANGGRKPQKASTLPSLGASVAPARKSRRLKKFRANQAANSEPNRQDLIQLLADKLCERCFETHYWLHGCSSNALEPLLTTPTTKTNNSNSTRQQPLQQQQQQQQQHLDSHHIATIRSDASCSPTPQERQDLSAVIARRNATFIKLVQQEVRSTISKSIELIDLIRREIKSPESIKQKQLMRCFSASIQLLTSVGNYVVPAQDISTFIPEVGQQQATLFSLPPDDFDHLLLYSSVSASPHHSSHRNQQKSINGAGLASHHSTSPPPPPLPPHHNNHNHNNHYHHQQQVISNYHLASAPDIPIRRRANNNKQQQQQLNNDNISRSKPLGGFADSGNVTSAAFGSKTMPGRLTATATANSTHDSTRSTNHGSNLSRAAILAASSPNGPQDSSSGASSNNSSASSSIARGAVQQSSLTRARTSSAILDGKTNHDLSFEAIARSLNARQHVATAEDDILFNQASSSRSSKFWQSSKFNFIKKLLHVKQQRLQRQQSKDRRIYNNKVQNKFRLVMMDLTHFNKSQQLLRTENGVNSLLTSMRNVLEFGLYLTLKLY